MFYQMYIKNFTITTTSTQLQLAYHYIYKLITSLSHITIICHTHTHISFNHLLCFEGSKERRDHIKCSCHYCLERRNAFSYPITVFQSAKLTPVSPSDFKVLTAPVYSCTANQHVRKVNWGVTVVPSPCKTGHQLSSLISKKALLLS